MKKKGLIVATIVMVLVLAVSLSTATYAWFSSEAQATVEDLNIAVKAATGVEIAVYESGDKYYNGDMSYSQDTQAWNSETEGFGTLLNFSNVNLGQINNAILYASSANLNKVPAAARFVYTIGTKEVGATLTTTDYIINADGSITQCTADSQAVADTTYATRVALTADSKFYRPTGLDNAGDPYGFYVAKPNDKTANVYTTYYDIPLAMRAVKNTNGIVCTLKIKPNGDITNTLYPGMAASTYVNMYITNASGEQYASTFEAYKSATYSSGAITGEIETEGAYSFVVAKGALTTSDIYKIRFEIWVEGTDPECNNTTTQATDFYVDYSFDVIDDEITDTSIEKDGVTYQVIEGLTQTKA